MKHAKRLMIHPYGCTFMYRTHDDSDSSYFVAGKFEFSCRYYSNRSGFVHSCKMYYGDGYSAVQYCKSQYYNRTWERWCFESVIKNCFLNYVLEQDWKFIEENKKDIRKICKDLEMNYYFKILDRI